jgi:hypothetical protein
MVVMRRGGGLGIYGEQKLHGAERLLAWLGWQSCVASAMRLSVRSTRLGGGGLTFMSGWWLCMFVRWQWYANGLPEPVVCRGSSASGGMSGWRSWKMVLAVRWGCGAAGCHGGGLETLLVWEHLKGLASSSTFKRPMYVPPSNRGVFSFRWWWMDVWSQPSGVSRGTGPV